MKTFTISPQLQSALEQMSKDMAVPVEGLVNQAVFNWAKLHGYVQPGVQSAAAIDEPETSRLPVTQEPEPDWKLASGGSFAPPVSDHTAPSMQKQKKLVLVLKDREVVIDSERFMVGRDVSCDLTIEAPRISRQHAVIHVLRDTIELEDLGSSNGTWYQGVRIEKRKLVDGDEIHFGDVPVRLEIR